MKLPVAIRPEAADDLQSTRDWYERQKDGLGEKFAAQVSFEIDRLAAMPELFAANRQNVRACRLSRLPYVINYRVYTDRIEVLGVLHGRRDASVWRSRL